MEALICPECGGRVEPPAVGNEYAKCVYCSTNFRIGRPVPVFRNDSAPVQAWPASGPSRPVGASFIIAIVAAAVIFAAFEFLSVQKRTSETVNSAQKSANDARAAANALKGVADNMANAARQIGISNAFPSPTPARRTTGK